MPRHRRRLDDRRVTNVEPVRQRDHVGRRGPELLGHPTVGRRAERPLGVRRAEVVRAAQAQLALHAAVERLDHHRCAVLTNAGEFVPEDPLQPVADVHQIRRTDARRAHVDELADAWRLVEMVEHDSTFGTSDGLHAPPRRRCSNRPSSGRAARMSMVLSSNGGNVLIGRVSGPACRSVGHRQHRITVAAPRDRASVDGADRPVRLLARTRSAATPASSPVWQPVGVAATDQTRHDHRLEP